MVCWFCHLGDSCGNYFEDCYDGDWHEDDENDEGDEGDDDGGDERDDEDAPLHTTVQAGVSDMSLSVKVSVSVIVCGLQPLINPAPVWPDY